MKLFDGKKQVTLFNQVPLQRVEVRKSGGGWRDVSNNRNIKRKKKECVSNNKLIK